MLICAICGFLCCGCAGGVNGQRAAMFGPAVLRINPTFTRFKSFDDDLRPDGIEADVELRDSFGDATKGAGRIYFELYHYDPQGPEVRGRRVGEPAFYDLSTIDAQKRHWQNVIRTYRFRLPWRDLDPSDSYVLSTTYLPGEDQPGRRLFDRLVVLPEEE